MSVRFSVVVPVHNNPADLRNCIESLKALDYPRERYEIIVVDNNSTDDTAAVASAMGVTCLSETQFQSSYAARNTGIKAAKGEFIAFTDSDCITDRGWLKAIDAASGDETAGCLAGEILSVPPTTTVERFSEKIGLLRQKGPLSGWHFKPYAQTANAVYRKAVFNRIGLFDPTTNSGGDAAIAWRMLDKTDFTIRFVPEAVVYHHHRTSVPDLYSQFRRYGGGKMSWALSQADYQPPAIAALEKDVVDLFARHIEALEAAGVDDEVLFSGLRAATQSAHLSGYLQDLLRYTTGGAPLANAPAIALERAPTCNICGSHSFVPGPNGRLTNRRPPQCRECGSLERHRTLDSFIKKFDHSISEKLRCLIVGDPIKTNYNPLLKSGKTKHSKFLHEEEREIYDIVFCLNYLGNSYSEEFEDKLSAIVSSLKDNGVLFIQQSGNHEFVAKLECMIANALPYAKVETISLLDDATMSYSPVVCAYRHPDFDSTYFSLINRK